MNIAIGVLIFFLGIGVEKIAQSETVAWLEQYHASHAAKQHTIEWKRVIVQNAALGYQSTDDEWQIETDSAVPARRQTWCLRRHAASTTHWSDCVAYGSLKAMKKRAKEKGGWRDY